MMSLIYPLWKRRKEGREERSRVLTLCDLKKCFDCVYLSEMYWFLVKNDANMKAVKMFQLLTGTNQLRIHSSDLG